MLTALCMAAGLVALGLAVLFWLSGDSRAAQRYRVALERRYAERRLEQITYEAMRRLLDEARQPRGRS
jgi:hypothetical protein